VLPITGVPLPLVSFGGSSMLVLLAAAGMLLNVARQEVWPVRASVLATTAQARRRGHGGAAAQRPGARPARAGGRQTPAQKAKADAEHKRARPRPSPTRTRREERR
jgi:cell division protein FtsW